MSIEKLVNSTKISNTKYLIIYLGVILGSTGQQISLPIFIGSFNGLVGGYFVVFWCSCMFNLFFWPVTFYRFYTGQITPEMKSYCYKKHYKFLLIGIFDALNGILIVFSSSLRRTPGSLQAVLSSSVIPFTMILSRVLISTRYTGQQLIGGLITIMGMVVALIPKFNQIGESSEEGSSSFLWPMVFLIGNIPGVLMNIMEENVFQDFSKFDNIFLLAWESLYQVITVGLLFWADIIPGFGTSESLENFGTRFADGFSCFFSPWNMEEKKCNFTALCGLIFTLAYCFSYIFGAALMKYASANSTAIVGSVSPTMVVFFWIIFPSLNKWALGDEYTKLQIICYVCALPIIIIGIIIFRKSEKENIKKKINEYNEGLINNNGNYTMEA